MGMTLHLSLNFIYCKWDFYYKIVLTLCNKDSLYYYRKRHECMKAFSV